MDQRLSTFLTDLEKVGCADEAWRTTVRFLRSFGMETVHAWFVGETDAGEDLNVITTCPDWWHQLYLEKKCDEFDVILNHCKTKYTPILHSVDAFEKDRRIDPRMIEMMRVTDEGFGLRSGIAIPVHTASKRLSGGINIGGPHKEHEFKKLADDTGLLLHIGVLSAHTKLQALLREQTASAARLSPRERECLLWLAAGLRTDQIAARLKLQNVTVNLHISNARKKLNASTRAQAVAKAMMLGILDP